MVKTKYFPSQERYLAKNPVVSFRLTKEEKEKLEEISEGEDMTVGEYVRDFLNGIVREREREQERYNNGYGKGYEKGVKDWGIWYICNICGKPSLIKPNTPTHDFLKKVLEDRDYAHTVCLDEQRRRQEEEQRRRAERVEPWRLI